MRRRLVSVLWMGLAACGGAPRSGDTTPSPCAAEDESLRTATDALVVCRETPPAPWSHGETYDALLVLLDHYDASLAFGDDGDEAEVQALAGASWSFLDELAGEVVDHRPLDAAEDATEALLRDREHDAAVEAVRAARAALGALHDALAAPVAPVCREEEDDEADARGESERCHAALAE